MSVLLEMFLFEQRNVLTKYTWQRKQKNIKIFIQFTGDINVASVSKHEFREFFDKVITPYNLSRNTVLGKLSDIGSIFNWAIRRGYTQTNPVKGFASTLSIPRKTSASEDANQPLSQKMLLDLLHHLKDENDLFTITILGCIQECE
jgi:site-specific recombinase XerC